ncbi:MAG TPA: MFS transporter [Candidatus Limnocylindrales bacterium]|nr:MFS transporter [Candidatus Limnocylindrales bacterium]
MDVPAGGRVLTEIATAGTILRDPVFARLWFIQAANQVGGNMALYALTVLVYSSTRSNSMVSALLVSFVLPQIALSPFAGVIVDRLDLRWALVVPNLVRTALTAGLALAGVNIPVVLALNLGVSLMSVALTPAEGSMIPRVVPREQLETAMSVFNLTLQASFAVGFAFFGPLLVTIANPSFVLGVVTLFYVAASLACIGLPSAPPVPAASGEVRASLHDPIDQLREGFAVVRHDQSISRPIILLATATSVAGVLGVLGPSLATTVGLEPEQLAVVVVPLGIGVVFGVLGLRRLGGTTPRRRIAEGGLLTLGAVTTALAGAGWLDGWLREAGVALGALPIVIGVAIGAGAAYAVTSVSAQTMLLESTPADVRGRVFGVLASIVSAASLIPSMVAGPLADRLSTQAAIVLAGVALLAVGIWSTRSR